VTCLTERGSRFVTVYDSGGVTFVKRSVCIDSTLWTTLISKDYNYTNTIFKKF